MKLASLVARVQAKSSSTLTEIKPFRNHSDRFESFLWERAVNKGLLDDIKSLQLDSSASKELINTKYESLVKREKSETKDKSLSDSADAFKSHIEIRPNYETLTHVMYTQGLKQAANSAVKESDKKNTSNSHNQLQLTGKDQGIEQTPVNRVSSNSNISASAHTKQAELSPQMYASTTHSKHVNTTKIAPLAATESSNANATETEQRNISKVPSGVEAKPHLQVNSNSKHIQQQTITSTEHSSDKNNDVSAEFINKPNDINIIRFTETNNIDKSIQIKTIAGNTSVAESENKNTFVKDRKVNDNNKSIADVSHLQEITASTYKSNKQFWGIGVTSKNDINDVRLNARERNSIPDKLYSTDLFQSQRNVNRVDTVDSSAKGVVIKKSDYPLLNSNTLDNTILSDKIKINNDTTDSKARVNAGLGKHTASSSIVSIQSTDNNSAEKQATHGQIVSHTKKKEIFDLRQNSTVQEIAKSTNLDHVHQNIRVDEVRNIKIEISSNDRDVIQTNPPIKTDTTRDSAKDKPSRLNFESNALEAKVATQITVPVSQIKDAFEPDVMYKSEISKPQIVAADNIATEKQSHQPVKMSATTAIANKALEQASSVKIPSIADHKITESHQSIEPNKATSVNRIQEPVITKSSTVTDTTPKHLHQNAGFQRIDNPIEKETVKQNPTEKSPENLSASVGADRVDSQVQVAQSKSSEHSFSDSMLFRKMTIEQIREIQKLILHATEKISNSAGSFNETTFNWNTPDFGKLKFTIGAEKSGDVAIEITSDRADIAEVIDKSKQLLERVFVEQGLRVERFEINIKQTENFDVAREDMSKKQRQAERQANLASKNTKLDFQQNLEARIENAHVNSVPNLGKRVWVA